MARKSSLKHLGISAISGLLTALCLHAAEAAPRFEEGAYANHKPDVKNGKTLFSVAGCGACHGSGDNAQILSGGMKMETAVGKFYATNISPGDAGIGGWTNAQFLNAVMDGIGRDGRQLYPVMPFNSYSGMKPEDVLDIKAYIETLPKADTVNKEHELPLISWWSDINFDADAWRKANMSPPYQQKEQTVEERGRYLANNVAGCGNCHTPHDSSFNLVTAKALKGWTGLTNVTAPDISRERIATLKSPDQFLHDFIVEGKKFSGAAFSDVTMRRLSVGLREMSEPDKKALYTYLSGQQIKEEAKVEVEKSPVAVCKPKKENEVVSTDKKPEESAKFAAAADAFMGKYCRNCHGPGQSDASVYTSGDLESIAADAKFVVPGDAQKSRMFLSITSGSMPKGTKPTADEIKKLEQWINALDTGAAPEQKTALSSEKNERGRELVSYKKLDEAAFKDIFSVPERDRPYQRYFSYRSQYNSNFWCEDDEAFKKRMSVYSGGFKKLINSLSDQRELMQPKEVEGTDDLLVRVDLRDLGWSTEDYEFLSQKYFYGIDPDSANAGSLKPLAHETQTKLPIMRVDWFMANAAEPENYNRLMKLPTHIKDLEDDFKISVARNIEERRIKRAGFNKGSSGVSDHNRMVERHDIATGYYWKSYDFAGDAGRQVLEKFPHGPKEIAPLDGHLQAFEHDGGEMIFSLPNGLQGYYLSDASGKQINVGPTTIVSHRKRPTGAKNGVTIVNARSCFDCHANGIIPNTDQLRSSIALSNLFNTDQKEILLAMYVEQKEMDEHYKADRDRFVAALSKLGVTENNGTTEQSLTAPAQAEIVTYNADKYDETLDLVTLAAEFDMTPEAFQTNVRTIADPNLTSLTLGWLNKLESGEKIERKEIEENYAALLPAMMNVDPLYPVHDAYDTAKKDEPADYAKKEEKKNDAYSEPAKKEEATDYAKTEDKPDDYQTAKKDDNTAAYQDDAHKTDDAYKPPVDPLILVTRTDYTNAYVGQKLTFDVVASKACELQVVYVEESGNVEDIPQAMVGTPYLQAGEKRTIPQPNSGDLTFDEPGKNETLVALCRVDGLGDFRLDKKKAKEIAAKHPKFKRGISISLKEKVDTDAANMAFETVNINVSQ
jgi:mono/diheme cytochrome c family protein